MNMTSNNNISQYQKWCETLKIELKKKSKNNVEQRMNQMIAIVNSTISDQKFTISQTDANGIIQSINTEIDSWRGVEIAETVQFPRTKLQPLLPHQALMQTNKFKDACKQFTKYYDNEWVAANYEKRDRVCSDIFVRFRNTRFGYVQTTKDRAKKTQDSFTKCLEHIKNHIQSSLHNVPELTYPFGKCINSQNASSESAESEMKLDAVCTLTIFDQPSINSQNESDICTLGLLDQPSASTLDTISDIMPPMYSHSGFDFGAEWNENFNTDEYCQNNNQFRNVQQSIPHIQAPNVQNRIPSNPYQQRMHYRYQPINDHYGPMRGSSTYISQQHRHSPIIPYVNTSNYSNRASPITPITPTLEQDSHLVAMPPIIDESEHFDNSFIDNDPFEFASSNHDFNFNPSMDYFM